MSGDEVGLYVPLQPLLVDPVCTQTPLIRDTGAGAPDRHHRNITAWATLVQWRWSARATGLTLSLSRRPMQSRPHPRRRLILSDLEHPTSRLDLGASAPPSDESARERGISEVDRDRVIQHPPHPRGRHRPAIGAAVLVEPHGDLGMPPPETVRRYGDPDTHRKSPFGRGDHFARVAWHQVFLVPCSFSIGRMPPDLRTVQPLGGSRSLGYVSGYVWPRPSLLRRNRNQARLLDPAASAHPERGGKLEWGA